MMFFLATLQADLPETHDDTYRGVWFTKAEKKDVILKFYKLNQTIPLSVDHTADKEYGSVIPTDKRVGRVLDLFMDKDGHLVGKCCITNRDTVLRLTKGSYIDNEKWGVSLRIDWCLPGGIECDKIEKMLTHVAVTTDPYLADYGSFVHHWSTNEKTIDRAIHREYYSEGDGHCFAAPELSRKLYVSTGMPLSLIKFVYLFCFIKSYSHSSLILLFKG